MSLLPRVIADPVGGVLDNTLWAALRGVSAGADAVTILARAGLLAAVRPDRALGMGLALRYGVSVAAGYAMCSARAPGDLAIIDDDGTLTYGEIDARTDALVEAYRRAGIDAGSTVGVLARNGRAFIEPVIAVGKIGAGVVLLNTAMAPPQLATVISREQIGALVVDDDLAELVASTLTRLPSEPAAAPSTAPPTAPSTAPTPSRTSPWTRLGPLAHRPSLPSRSARSFVTARPHAGRLVLLTSGTTGAPKGAARKIAGVGPALALLDAIPFRTRERTLIASPLFRAWGIANLALGALLGSTLVLRRTFDAETVLADLHAHEVSTLAAVPVLLQRLLDLPADVRAKHDTSALRIAAISGSALPARLATEFQDAFGDVIYNLYGSTEVGYATVAGPEDLREDPATAGRVLRGVTVRLVDDEQRDVAAGESGHIYVGSEMSFSGYTGGEDKPRLDGLVSTGDTGHFDEHGRLRVEGRDDDMIVSGGENVFPGEVEEIIAAMPGVREAAVLGVPDETFGQRLVAFVVADTAGAVRAPDATVVRAEVRTHLAAYKVPRTVTFLDALPRNAAGKVVRRELMEGDRT